MPLAGRAGRTQRQASGWEYSGLRNGCPGIGKVCGGSKTRMGGQGTR